jgi:RNA recognition motif-containing protein
MKLYVGNLSYETTEDNLRDMFGEHGEVVSANVVKDKFTDRSKGFAFVEMANDEEAKAAISSLNGAELGGRQIKVDEARPPRDRDQRRRGGGGGGGGGGRRRREW